MQKLIHFTGEHRAEMDAKRLDVAALLAKGLPIERIIFSTPPI